MVFGLKFYEHNDSPLAWFIHIYLCVFVGMQYDEETMQKRIRAAENDADFVRYSVYYVYVINKNLNHKEHFRGRLNQRMVP